MSENILLFACGSFNPPTPMHFRMFEIARDHFRFTKQKYVIGGIVSPVHDSYQKPSVHLISAEHRFKMIKLSLQSSGWIGVSNWESCQQNWTRTYEVLKYHQNYLNSILNDENENSMDNIPNWIPTKISKFRGQRIRIKLLCGADLLESFANKNLWNDTEIESILGDHGIVVIARHGSNPQKFIFDSDLLFKYKNNITIIENWVPNEVSSTLARLHFRRGLSLKYLLNDDVIKYIYENRLYGTNVIRCDVPKPHQTIKSSVDRTNKTKHEENDETNMDETDNSPKKKSRKSNQTSSRKRKYSLRGQTASKV